MKKLLAILSLTTAMFATAAQAQALLGFDFAGTTTDPQPANLLTSNITSVQGLSRVGLGTPSTSNNFGSNGWNITDTFNEGNDYIAFSLSVDSGYQISLTDLTWTRLNASSTGPGTGRWGYSVNGGAFVLQDTFAITTSSASGSWSSIGLTDATGTIEFRFWAYGTVSAGGGASATAGSVNYRNSVAGDDLVLNGSVSVIPEPSTYTLLALAAAGFGGYVIRRRRR
jgi:hypothetical protein